MTDWRAKVLSTCSGAYVCAGCGSYVTWIGDPPTIAQPKCGRCDPQPEGPNEGISIWRVKAFAHRVVELASTLERMPFMGNEVAQDLRKAAEKFL